MHLHRTPAQPSPDAAADAAALTPSPAPTGRTLLGQSLTGLALLAGMNLVWAGSIVHYGNGDHSDPVALLADAHAHPGALNVTAATDVASMTCFVLAALGLAAMVRGRGRGFTLVVGVLLVVGSASHVLGGAFTLTLTRLAGAGLSPDDERRAVTELLGLQNLYFIALIPFLLAILLIPAALWRARVVCWGPLAMIAVEVLVVGRFTSSTTPSSPWWWIDPVVSVAAYAWLAAGVSRYRPAGLESGSAPRTTPAPSPDPFPEGQSGSRMAAEAS